MRFAPPFIPQDFTHRDSLDYAWAEHASQESVFERLRAGEKHQDSFYWNGFGESIEEYLLSRNEPLINLGLAAYAHDSRILKFIYENGDDRCRKIVLSNRFITNLGNGGWLDVAVQNLVETDNFDFLFQVLKNPHLDCTSVITDLIEKKSIFHTISQNSWRSSLRTLLRHNPRLGFSNNSREIEIHFSEKKMFTALWGLFDILPTDDQEEYAQEREIDILDAVCDKLRQAIASRAFSNALRPAEDINRLLSRWTVISERKNSLNIKHILEFLESQITLDESGRSCDQNLKKSKQSRIHGVLDELLQKQSENLAEIFSEKTSLLIEQNQGIQSNYSDCLDSVSSLIKSLKMWMVIVIVMLLTIIFFR
jgi:hypothetical protein